MALLNFPNVVRPIGSNSVSEQNNFHCASRHVVITWSDHYVEMTPEPSGLPRSLRRFPGNWHPHGNDIHSLKEREKKDNCQNIELFLSK